jgi:hypothetical protein
MSRRTPEEPLQLDEGSHDNLPRVSWPLLPVASNHNRDKYDNQPVSPVSEVGHSFPSQQQQKHEMTRSSRDFGDPADPGVRQTGSRNETKPESIPSRPPVKRSHFFIPDSRTIPSWWWWWEIAATVISIACMCALVVLLVKIDNTPLQSWWPPIQPNTTIAVLTTIGQAALMVPVASCISQLKWRHFLLQPRKLVDLQLFDEASRGPWGSAVLLYRLSIRPKVMVALGFSIVTIVAMGIDVCSQQVLDLPLQDTQLTNSTIEIGKADMYFSKGFIEDPTKGTRTILPPAASPSR